jgi:hypothetical protein
MTILLGAADLVLYAAIAVILVLKYRGTKEAGFLWLVMPLVLIPALALPVTLWRHAMTDRWIAGKSVSLLPFTLVEQGRLTPGSLLTLLNFADHVAWGVFALAAVLVLVRRKK